MPNQLIALVTQLTAKRASFVSIRHSPGFGIATKVMGGNPRNTGGFRISLQELPDNLFAQTDALRPARSIHRAEYASIDDPGCSGPRVGRHFHPRWHRDRSDPSMFTAEIHDAPTPVPLLDVADRKCRHL